MKLRLFLLILGLCSSQCLCSQDSLLLQIEARMHEQDSLDRIPIQVPAKPLIPMGRAAVSFNGAGIIMFGPMLHAEVGLAKFLRLDTHVRFLQAGIGYNAQSYHYVDAVPSPGLGLLFIMNPEDNNKFIFSLAGEYGYHSVDEWWGLEEYTYAKYHLGIYGAGMAWRLRFTNGFFLHCGAYLFYASGTEWYRYDYGFDDPMEWTSGPYHLEHPWIQFDVRMGLELWRPKKGRPSR